MKNFTSIFTGIQNNRYIRAIRNGLITLLPIIMTGSFALILRSFPVDAYQNFISQFANGLLYKIFSYAYNATFGMLSVYMASSIGYNVAKESKYNVDSPMLISVSFTSLAAFLVSVGLLTTYFNINSLSAVGMFCAILCGVPATLLYLFLYSRINVFKLFSDGSDPFFNKTLRAIIPSAIVICIFAVINAAIMAFTDASCIWNLVVIMFNYLFSAIGNDFGGGLLYILLSSIFWFFGIHGSNMLESINQNIFAPAAVANEQAVSLGLEPSFLYTKTFFDVFVLIGGCGTLLSLLIALLLFSKRKSNKSLGGMAALPMLFNINELMVFGLPIIFNPILLVPFITVPVVSFLISAAAMKSGLVPYTGYAVEWTTPVILGGYQATGSVAGAVLQVINLSVGVLIYMPFVKLYDRLKAREARENIGALISVLSESEKLNKSIALIEIPGVRGEIAKQLVNDMRVAILKNELFMEYQPQFNRDGKVIGAEALLRWEHKNFGRVYPPLIIKLAQESSQMLTLEKYVFRRVKSDMQNIDWKCEISINSTATSIRNSDFNDFLISEFPNGKINNTQICIEITEQSELVSDSEILEKFKNLKNNGFLLAIDDFSMGFTSLKYLSDNRFDTVKLDGSLIRGLGNSRNADIIASIVYLSNSLGFSVLAEFVETTQQRDMLEQIGCTEYQGYLYSKPVSVNELTAFMKNNG